MKQGKRDYRLKRTLIYVAIIVALLAATSVGVYVYNKGNDTAKAATEQNITLSEDNDVKTEEPSQEGQVEQENIELNINNDNIVAENTVNDNISNDNTATDNTNTATNTATDNTTSNNTNNIQEREVVDTVIETVETGTEAQYLSWTTNTSTIGEILPEVETAIVEISKAVDVEKVEQNGDITYTLTISSDKELENVSVKDLIPEMTTFKSIENDGRTVVEATSNKVVAVRWELNLNEENNYTQIVRFTVTANEDATGIIVNDTAIANGITANSVETNVLAHIKFVENGGTDVEDILNKDSETTIENRTMPTITKVGYVFAGWYDNAGFDGDEVTTLPEKYVAGTTTYYAKWTPATDTKYTVRHWKQNIVDNNYTEVEVDRQILEGTTEDLTVAVANTYTGFTAKDFDQVEILPDGSSIVDIYYDRNVYTITYDIVGTKFAQDNYAQESYKFEANVTPVADPQAHVGYTFSGWSTIPTTMPANDVTIEGRYNPNTDTAYTVKHFQKNANDNGYTLVDTDNLTGTTDEMTNAVAKDYTGFVAQPFDQAEIKPDGSTVINIYYNRNVWTLTYKVTGTINATDDFAHADYKYGQDVTPVQTPSKVGYHFVGWDNEPTTMPNNDLTVTGRYAPNTDTKYKVEHYKQNIENDEYTLAETDNKEGTTDELTSAEAKTYEGFTAQSFNQENIAPDGSTVIKIYYTRNRYTLNYKIEGSLFATVSYATDEYKFEAPVTAIATPDKVGYTFNGWYEVPTTMPSHDAEAKGNYTPNSDTRYTVKHFKQNVDDDNYTEVTADEQTLTGITGATTNAVAKTYAGFTAQSFEQKEIAADGSTVIEIYYNRNNYTLTYKIIGDYFTNDSYATETYRYGKAITAIATPEEVGYNFFGWNNVPQTMPANDAVATGNYTPRTDTRYIVVHHQENANDDDYTVVDIDYLTGTTLNTTAAEAKTYEGFTVQPFRQEQIKADGTTVVNIYYKRNVHTITYNITGNYFAQNGYGTQSYKYGQDVTAIDTPSQRGYIFEGWRNVPTTMPNEDVTAEGNFVVGPTTYTVKHMLQNIDDNDYTEDVAARETLDGITEDMTNAIAKDYTGFTALSITQVQIAADGSTVVEIRYNRNNYTLTYKITGFYKNNDNYYSESIRYGKAVTAIALPQEEAGYTFIGWNNVPDTMPARDVTATGVYVANPDTPYKVEHYLQNIDDDNYVLDDTENKTGTTDTFTYAVAKRLEGFTAKFFEQEKIKGDGSTVIKIYYDRNVNTITYKITGEKFASNSNFARKKYKYGATIEDVIAPTHAGYEFSGWKLADCSDIPATMPDNDLEAEGYYTALTVNYTVEHYQENIENTEYTLFESETKQGLTDTLTEATAKDYVGFTVQNFEQKTINGDGSTVVKIYYTRNRYTIKFNKNDDVATGTMDNMTVKFGQEISLTENAFEKYNYEFKEWNTLADGTGTAYEDKAKFAITENNINLVNSENVIDLHAQWQLLYARFNTGSTVNNAIKALGGRNTSGYNTTIVNIVRTLTPPTTDNYKEVQTTDSTTPIKMWIDENDSTKLLWYTKDPEPELNNNCSSMFTQLSAFKYQDITDVCSTANVTNMAYMFSGSGLEELDASNWDVDNVTSFVQMFMGCGQLKTVKSSGWTTKSLKDMNFMFCHDFKLTSVDTKNWDTSNVTNMSYSFYDTYSLSTIDVSNWKTGKVTTMQCMFYKSDITSLDVSDWDTSNVTTMARMFNEAKRLQTLNVSNWNTSKVTTMNSMFAGCSVIDGLVVSNWDTSNVTDMSGMFDTCHALTSIDADNWNVDKVTTMARMFYECSNLTKVKSTAWETKSLTDMNFMFCHDGKLTSVDTQNWDTSNVTNMSYSFHNTRSLSKIDVSKWKTGKVTNFANMFNTSGITTLDVSGWNTSSATNITYMFSACSKLTALDVSKWNVSNVTALSYTFSDCSSLSKLDVSKWNVNKVTTLEFTFSGCSKLTSIDVSDWVVDNVTNMKCAFNRMSKLQMLDLSKWNTSKTTNTNEMFGHNYELTTIYTSDKFVTEQITNSTNMFYGCGSLVGGNGTLWNGSIIDKTYARIDMPATATEEAIPGYFTAKP